MTTEEIPLEQELLEAETIRPERMDLTMRRMEVEQPEVIRIQVELREAVEEHLAAHPPPKQRMKVIHKRIA